MGRDTNIWSHGLLIYILSFARHNPTDVAVLECVIRKTSVGDCTVKVLSRFVPFMRLTLLVLYIYCRPLAISARGNITVFRQTTTYIIFA